MILGVFTAYVGIAVWGASPSGLILSMIFIMAASLYIRLVEEKELEVRFGSDYVIYKKSVPFIIPYLRGKS